MSTGDEGRAVEPLPDVGELDTASPSDACGCAPQVSTPATPANVVDAEQGNSSEPRVAPATPDSNVPEPRDHTVKLVALLRRTEDGYRVQLAAGADGCDPVLRLIDVPDVSSALAALGALVAEGEVRWRAEPRYPSAARTAPPPRPRAPMRQATGIPASAPPSSTSGVTPSATAASVQSSGDQLSLFG
jgi:hypothetical protein